MTDLEFTNNFPVKKLLHMLPSINARRYATTASLEAETSTGSANHAKTLSRLPTAFTSALAHEIRNPITNINLSVEILRSELPDEVSKNYLDIIVRSSKRINDLVTELLNQRKKRRSPDKGFSIQKLLDEALQLTEDRIGLKKIVVLKNYAQDDCRIVLHRSEIKIGLANIILNALDAMEAGKGLLTLTTRSIPGKYIIEVQDNGCGISKENLKHIFKPFFSSKPGGLGIGLSATYAILRSDHVEVTVKSKEGEGTSFILSFHKMPA
jgi:signal transduction histidine kinase